MKKLLFLFITWALLPFAVACYRPPTVTLDRLSGDQEVLVIGRMLEDFMDNAVGPKANFFLYHQETREKQGLFSSGGITSPRTDPAQNELYQRELKKAVYDGYFFRAATSGTYEFLCSLATMPEDSLFKFNAPPGALINLQGVKIILVREDNHRGEITLISASATHQCRCQRIADDTVLEKFKKLFPDFYERYRGRMVTLP